MARYGDLDTLVVKWIHATPTQKQNFKQIIDTHPTADVVPKSENVIVLPCAIGTTIYELIFEKEDPCSWCEHDHSGFGDYICDFNYAPYPYVKDFLSGEKICPKNQIVIYDLKFNLEFYHSDEKWFNITWFLTKEEAEEALAELKKKYIGEKNEN